MIGAIVGDIAGSRFEFDNCKDKDFELFVRSAPIDGMSSIDTDATLVESVYTDDSVMTLAVADAVCR